MRGKDRYLFLLQAALAQVPDHLSAMLTALHRSVSVSGYELQDAIEASFGIAQRNPPAHRRRYRKRRFSSSRT